MSVVSGLISRQVLPACGSLCFFCPAMRARSRQPVKRYKKLISDIFPKSQDEEPNDRKIGKLCEYASKNPLRIPKIADSLEQRCYKELRIENFRNAKIVMSIYRKLLISCKEQMPLFANSLLSILHTLLEQSQQDDMLVVGCLALFDFVNNQKDATYMFNLDGFIPKLCQLAQEAGDDERVQILRAASLQALSAMVWFMGENSHISVEFDNIVQVVLENYKGPSKESGEPNQNRWVQEVHKTEGHISPSAEALAKVPSWRLILNDGQLNVTPEDAKNPCFWSRVCLHNMAKLGKEATTMRRVLEALFRYFDNGNLWTAKHGIAFPVLKDMQLLMDDSGQNTHFLLSILVKHLDHKSVLKQPEMQLDIVQVITILARLTKVQSSVAIVSAVSDIMRHLRKSIHCSLDDANLGEDLIKWNKSFHESVDECLTELSSKVGDAGLILDVMASMLENISSITVIARTTISAVYRTAQIIATMPNLSYSKKAFPETLFHQLIPAMVHPDHETRIGAHQIFAVVLVPSSVSPLLEDTATNNGGKKNMEFPRTLSRTVSVFSSSAALFEKLGKQRRSPSRVRFNEVNKDKVLGEEEQSNETTGVLNKIKSSYSRASSFKPTTDADSLTKSTDAVVPLRLSSHQITLLLSSIWAQSMSTANMPENFEAIAHTYSLVLLFSRAKTSYRDCLIRCFQLAFSLRNVSLAEGGKLPHSRRRSLYLLSISMIIFASKAYNIIPLIPHIKATMANKVVDPFLCLVEDATKLQISEARSGQHSIVYGSKEDESSAQRLLSETKITEDQTVEYLVSMIIKNMENLPESEELTTREQLLKDFLPDDLCSSIGGQMFHGSPEKGGQADAYNRRNLEKVASMFGIEDDHLPDSFGSSFKFSPHTTNLKAPNLLSVDDLLQSVLETAHNVGRMSVSTAPETSYKDVANHCETKLMGKQQKMSYLINTQQTQGSYNKSEDNNQETPSFSTPQQNDFNPFLEHDVLPSRLLTTGPPALCAAEYKHNSNSFRLPSSSPYDNFLKAAGC